MLDTITNNTHVSSVENEWKIVTNQRRNRSKNNDCDTMFSFDEDISNTEISPRNYFSKNNYSDNERPKKLNKPKRKITVGSLPEQSPKKWISKGRRARSSSTKTSIQQHVSYVLLKEGGFSQEIYESYREKCLKDRMKYGAGRSSEMSTLFRFWSHYLRNHFDVVMYNEFCSLSMEDALQNQHYGLECLFRFFSYGLEKSIRFDLLEDFQNYVLFDINCSSCYGLEKFWAFLKYRKDQQPIQIIPTISEYLENLHSIEDIKNLEKKIKKTNQHPPTSKGLWVKKL